MPPPAMAVFDLGVTEDEVDRLLVRHSRDGALRVAVEHPLSFGRDERVQLQRLYAARVPLHVGRVL